MLKKVIAVGGPSGVGKSAVSMRIAAKYRFPRLSVGHFFRRIAIKTNVSVYELARQAENNSDIDRSITAMAIKEIERVKQCVIDGHGACLFLEDEFTYKVLLYAPFDVRARRISNREHVPIRNIKRQLLELDENTYSRFERLYRKNLYDPHNYDIAINTTKCDADELCVLITHAVDVRGFLNERS